MDATNGFEIAYRSIIEEMSREMPESIIVPVGSGELFLGLEQGIREHGFSTKLVGVTVQLQRSIAKKLFASFRPSAEKIEKLIREGHQLIQLSERDVIRGMNSVPSAVYASEPSASVVFSAAQYLDPRIQDIVLVNTGSGI